jgi:hypothetical protein
MQAVTAEMVTRIQTCQRHARDYAQVFWPRVPGLEPFWVGQCDECKIDAALAEQAEALIDPCELERRVNDAVSKSGPEIRAQVELELSAETARVRPLFEESITEDFREMHEETIRAELKAGIVETLKGR